VVAPDAQTTEREKKEDAYHIREDENRGEYTNVRYVAMMEPPVRRKNWSHIPTHTHTHTHIKNEARHHTCLW
jgi:hypothetical protein